MIYNPVKISSIILSILVAFYFFSVFFISTTSFEIITPIVGILLTIFSLFFFTKSFKLVTVQWLYLSLLFFLILWIWLDFLVRSTDEYLLVLAITYQFGVVLLAGFVGQHLNYKVLIGIVFSGVVIVSLSAISTGGILLIRLNSIYQDSINQLGALLALAAGVSVWLIDHYASKKKSFYSFLYTLIAILLFIAIIFIGSRQTIILILPWLVMLWLLKRKKWLIFGGITIVVIFIMFSLYFSDIYIFARFSSFFLLFSNDFDSVDYSTLHRLDLINYASKAWIESPVYGKGIRAFEKLSGFGHYAHNNYLEMLYNFGLIGFVLFYLPIIIVLVYSTFWFRKNYEYQKKWLALIIGSSLFILIQGIFIVDYFRYVTWSCLVLISLSLKKAN